MSFVQKVVLLAVMTLYATVWTALNVVPMVRGVISPPPAMQQQSQWSGDPDTPPPLSGDGPPPHTRLSPAEVSLFRSAVTRELEAAGGKSKLGELYDVTLRVVTLKEQLDPDPCNEQLRNDLVVQLSLLVLTQHQRGGADKLADLNRKLDTFYDHAFLKWGAVDPQRFPPELAKFLSYKPDYDNQYFAQLTKACS